MQLSRMQRVGWLGRVVMVLSCSATTFLLGGGCFGLLGLTETDFFGSSAGPGLVPSFAQAFAQAAVTPARNTLAVGPAAPIIDGVLDGAEAAVEAAIINQVQTNLIPSRVDQ